MAKEFKFQDPGEGIHEAEIIDVLVSEGDRVEEGQSVFEVETDKAATEAPSPHSGTIEKIHVKKGDVVEVGDVLITFSDGEGDAPKKEKDKKKGKKKKAAAKKKKSGAQKKEPEEKQKGKKKEVEKGDREPEAKPEEAESREKPEEAKPSEGPVPASPATRRMARELGVDLREVEGSGPGGRVTSDDVRKFAGEPEEEEPPPAKEEPRKKEAPEKREPEEEEEAKEGALPALAEVPPLPDFSRWGEVTREPLRGIRRATAKQMALAWSQIPHVMHRDVADITELEKFRQSSKEKLDAEGASLSVTVFVLKAVAAALREFPRFNASLDPEAGELVLKDYCHIGVAVDTEQGLLVPVIRDVDRKSIQELAKELVELAGRARAGELKREEMEGGSFTVTNPGPLGGTSFTPIINYPEVAILGLAKATIEPVIEGDLDQYEIVPRYRLPLCLAFDHRVNDGAGAARFASHIKELLADPESFVLAV